MVIIIARPQWQAQQTKLLFESHFHNVDMFSPVRIVFNQYHIERFIFHLENMCCDAIIFTSQNAIRALQLNLPDYPFQNISLPVFVVGERTKEAALECGFENVRCASSGDLTGIILLLEENACINPIFGAGRDRKMSIIGVPSTDISHTYELYQAERKNNILDFPCDILDVKHILCFSSRMFKITYDLLRGTISSTNDLKDITWHIVGKKELYGLIGQFIFYNSPDLLYDAFNVKINA